MKDWLIKYHLSLASIALAAVVGIQSLTTCQGCSPATQQTVHDIDKGLEVCTLPAIARVTQCLANHDSGCFGLALAQLVECVNANMPKEQQLKVQMAPR